MTNGQIVFFVKEYIATHFGIKIPITSLYEILSQLSGYKNWNIAKSKRVNFSQTIIKVLDGKIEESENKISVILKPLNNSILVIDFLSALSSLKRHVLGSNTRIVYQYRDAGNYKFHYEIVIKGFIDIKTQSQLLEQFGEESEGFDPRKTTSFPSMSPEPGSENYDEELGHPFHELCYFERTEEEPTCDYTVKTLISDLRKASK